MTGKMLDCLKRCVQVGGSGILIQSRDYYDLLWFMHQHIKPFAENLEQDRDQPFNVATAKMAIQEKAKWIKPEDLAVDLLPLFEQRTYIEAWTDAFQENFRAYVKYYL